MLTVRISDESRAGLDNFCAANGITVTALMEAIGRRLAQLPADTEAGTPALELLHLVAAQTVALARSIDAERRSRTKPDGEGGAALSTGSSPANSQNEGG